MDNPAKYTQIWVEHFIIKLGLCPFASQPFKAGRLRIVSYDDVDENNIIQRVLSESRRLLATNPNQLETTLAVFPNGLTNFSQYLEVADTLDLLFVKNGFEGILQIATFHPEYTFADSLQDDPADYTNRSPYPMFHLLREESVTRAVENHPDIDQVPLVNQKKLRNWGKEKILQYLKEIYSLYSP